MPNAYIVGATGALGTATARAFRRAGWGLALAARSQDALQRLAGQLALEPSGGGPVPRIAAVALDASAPEAVESALDAWEDLIGPLDACLHLAGGYAGGRAVHEWSPADWRAMFDTNFWGPVFVLSTAFRRLVARGRPGALLAVGAVAGIDSPAGRVPYGVSKAALLHLIRGLAEEGRPHNIRANALVPVVLDTEANRRAMPKADPARWTPLDKAAEILLRLSSPEMAAVTGSCIRL